MKGKTIEKYFNSFSSWAVENSISKLKQTIENSKKLLEDLKNNKNLTLSQALENKVRNEQQLSDTLNRTTNESAVINELEINIDQKDSISLSDSNIFLIPNAVPLLASLDQTSTIKNESISDHELNVDHKNFSFINTSTSQTTIMSNNLSRNESLQNMTSSINTHDFNIDSRLGNLTGLSQSINMTANQSLFNGNNSTLSLHDRNIDSKSLTLSLTNTTNQTLLDNENESINKFELNIDTKEDVLTQFKKPDPLKSAHNPNNSLQNVSSSINSHELNLDSRLGNLTGLQQSVNISANQSALNIHQHNTTSNTTIQTTLPSENETINNFELNIDSKQEILNLSNKASTIKSNQFDFSDVNKLMSIVSALPIDMSILKTISLPKTEPKRELNSIDANGPDSKRYKIEQASLLNETKKINHHHHHHHQTENKFNDRKNDSQYQTNKTVDLHGANHTYYCNFIKSDGQKCTFITQYIRHYKKHLKNQKHGEQENFSQNIESSYYTSITPNSNVNQQSNVSSATTSSNSNKSQHNQPKSNYRTSNSNSRFY